MPLELTGRKRLQLFSGSANEPLAEEVAGLLDIELGRVTRTTFPNGEIYIRFDESVRGADAFVMQSHSHPINHHIIEQLLMLDALERASAKRKTAVMPFFGYARQDRKSKAREPISARLMGDLFTSAGADRIVAMDLHSQQIQGFIHRPFDHLTALPVLKDYLQSTLEPPLVIVSPDTGRVRVASKYARHLDSDVAFVHKRRSGEEGEVAALQVVGDVEGKHAVIVDDMIDTAGTVVAAADLLKEAGAVSVRALATHGVLSEPAIDRIKKSPIEELVITNTLPVPETARSLPALKVISIAPIIADALKAIFTDASVSRIFEGENAF